jgi:outer membrane protein TolC
MMKKLIHLLLIILIAPPALLSAQQERWTLEDCISYALSNNIGLQRKGLQTESAEIDFRKSKMDLLPNLNFGSDARIGFGRSIDPVTNLITFKQNLSNSYTLSSGIEVFNGFAALNTISANKFMLKAGIEAEKVQRNTLIVDIMGQYYQVIYARGLEEAAKMQLDLSEKQLFRISRMVNTGRESVAREYEIASQVSADRLTWTTAQSSSSRALTQLRQMLQLEPGTEFNILLPDLEAILITGAGYDTDSIYNIASSVLPRLKAIEYELRASENMVAVARGALAPSLTVGGAIFTGYYKVIGENGDSQASFSTQLRNNNSQAVYFSLNIPIFNRYTASRNIKQAVIRKEDTRLRLELERNSLYTEIEDACLNYNRGREEYIAAEANLAYNEKSFDAVEKKFEAGLVDVTDYAAAKTTLFSAETEALRTKLQLLIRKLTIEFYTNGEYENIATN